MSPKKILDILTRPRHLGSRRLLHAIGIKKEKKVWPQDPMHEEYEFGDTRLIFVNHPKRLHSDLLKEFRLHPIHIDDIFSEIQRPKIDAEDKYIFFVLHFPLLNPENSKIESREVDFILTRNTIIVSANHTYHPVIDIIHELCRDMKSRENLFYKGTGFLLYAILDRLFDRLFPLLAGMEQNLEKIDKEIFSARNSRRAIENISLLRRNVIFFETVIKPELTAFQNIRTIRHPLLSAELKKYFTNVTDHLTKIWDRLEDVKELSDNLSRTFESYFSFKTNETIKVLTIFSVILMPLNLLAGIYGMNLAFLPFANHELGLVMIGGIMIFLILTMLAFFRLEKWI